MHRMGLVLRNVDAIRGHFPRIKHSPNHLGIIPLDPRGDQCLVRLKLNHFLGKRLFILLQPRLKGPRIPRLGQNKHLSRLRITCFASFLYKGG